MDPVDYADTIRGLDEARKKVLGESRSHSTTSIRLTPRIIPRMTPQIGPFDTKTTTSTSSIAKTKVSTKEAQLARIQVAATKDWAKLQELHKGLRQRIATGEELSDADLDNQASEAVRLRHRLEYYNQIGKEISEEAGPAFWEDPPARALTNPEAAIGLRPLK